MSHTLHSLIRLGLLLCMAIFATAAPIAFPDDLNPPAEDVQIDLKDEALARALRLTEKDGVLPAWTTPTADAARTLSEQARRCRSSIFIVGHAKGGFGTAFVISQQHRLLATNAHVADILHAGGEMYAIGNETSISQKISEVWYHPGVIRRAGSELVRSQDPRVGLVDPRSPDVAVLKLESSAALPSAMPLASREETLDAFSRPIAMLGFPGHDTEHWPKPGERVSATYRQGFISRVSDFTRNATADMRDRQFLSHDMASWGGFSGSPIFLANGHVIGLHNSGGTVRKGNDSIRLAYGIRIDCLWELLAHHKMAHLVQHDFRDADLRPERFQGIDPGIRRVEEGRQLARAAMRDLFGEKNYKVAEERAAKAASLAPNDAFVQIRAASVYGWIGGRLPDEKQGRYYQRSRQFAEQAFRAEPHNVDAVCSWGGAEITLAKNRLPGAKELSMIRKALALTEQLQGLSVAQQAEIKYLMARTYDRTKRKEAQTAYDLVSRAIDLYPCQPGFYGVRASLARVLGKDVLSDEERRQRIIAAYEQDSRAWRLATSAQAAERDGRRAAELARQACDACAWKHAGFLETLAAAHAELGQFEDAIRRQQSALSLAKNDDQQAEATARLELYRAGKPYRESEGGTSKLPN